MPITSAKNTGGLLLGRLGWVERVELPPFDGGELAAQLEAIAGRRLDASLIESIHARSGGNAFFAEELLRAAEEEDRADLPGTLRDVLLGLGRGAAEVEALGSATRVLLRHLEVGVPVVEPRRLEALDEE